MAYRDMAAARTGAAAENLNRILLGVCAAVWLIALGAAVAATVALTELGRSRPAVSSDGDTPWLLYTVIGVSAVVIIGAVPLLLRARQTAQAEPEPVVVPAKGPRRQTNPRRRSCVSLRWCNRCRAGWIRGYRRRRSTGCGCSARWCSASRWASR